MDAPKLILLMCCAYFSCASQHSHTIPVEGYETELQDLGQHVEVPDTPVKVIKITKTIAVKVPVPYPVKVIQKVPYPVHVVKPYPVPVPQIIKVPHAVAPKYGGHHEPLQAPLSHDGNAYHVQEVHTQDAPENDESYGAESDHQSYEGGSPVQEHNFGSYGDDYSPQGSSSSYDAAPQSYHGSAATGDNNNSFESQSYDQAIKHYLHNQPTGNNFNYH